MQNIFLVVSFIFCVAAQSHTQEYSYYNWPTTSEVDSLKSQLLLLDDDLQKMEICRSISMYYWMSNQDSAIFYSQKHLGFARVSDQSLWQAEAHKNLAFFFQRKRQFLTAFRHAQQGLEIASSPAAEENMFSLGSFSDDLDPSISRKRVLANLMLSTSIIHRNTGNLDQAFLLLDQARSVAMEINDLPLLADIGIALAFKFYYFQKPVEIDSAIHALQAAHEYVRRSKNHRIEYHILGILGQIYYQDLHHDSLAYKYLNQALESATKYGNQVGIGFTNLYLAHFQYHLGNIDSALVFAQQSLSSFLLLSDPNNSRRIYRFLIKVYDELSDVDSAYKYQSLLLATDELINQDQEIRDLQKELFDKEIDSLEQISDEKSRKAKAKINALIFGLSIILLFAFVLYRNNRQKNKLNSILKQQKVVLDETITALRTTEAELIQSDAQKNKLFTNITHEFRTPLTVIKGMSRALHSDIIQKDYGGVEEGVLMIHRNSDQLLHLVNQMLDLAKLEHGRMDLKLVQGDMVAFIRYLGECFQSSALNHEITLMIDSTVDSLIMDFDAEKIATVVSNLLTNAIKFTSACGKITISLNVLTEGEKDTLSISIADTGIGISDENIPKIFERFFQVDHTFSRSGQGTGIGLALTKELVVLMGGIISVESKLKQGTIFTIQIPVQHTAPAQKEMINFEGPEVAFPLNNEILPFEVTNNYQLELPLALIIEDNQDVISYLQKCLSGKYETLHASNGKAGIETALDRIPDVIISDIMMPEKDGLEVCATLKANQLTDHIPIILLTAKATVDDRLEGLSLGADAYLSKPFLEEELLTRLDQLVLLRKKLIKKFRHNQALYSSIGTPLSTKIKFIDTAVKLIHKNLSDPNFSVMELAKQLKYSESQTYRKIKAETGLSAIAFINRIRLQKAKELIQCSDGSISEIAYQTGFEDPSYFSRVFKEAFGSAPYSTRKTGNPSSE